MYRHAQEDRKVTLMSRNNSKSEPINLGNNDSASGNINSASGSINSASGNNDSFSRANVHDITIADIAHFFAPRDINSHKGSFGYVALMGGSLNYSGAIRLSALANCAMRSGAGVVTIALPRSLSYLIAPEILECTIFPLSDKDGEVIFVQQEMDELIKRVSVIAFGMGIGRGGDADKCLDYLLKNFTGTMIIDADGLNALSEMNSSVIASATCKLILTPHPKEFSRLSGLPVNDILADPAHYACSYAAEHSVTVLLKGHTTTVSDGKITYTSSTGCAGMATAGSGDVLSGVLAALFGAHPNEQAALTAVAGAYITGLAGEIAQQKTCDICMIASDTAAALCEAIILTRGR